VNLSKKFEMAPIGYSGARGKLLHENNRREGSQEGCMLKGQCQKIFDFRFVS
jgi:hypothetical protein